MSQNTPYIIGFSDSVHDRAVCLFHGARPVVAIEEERLSRIKHAVDFQGLAQKDPAIFEQLNLDSGSSDDHQAHLQPLVDYCLSQAGIGLQQIDLWIGNSLHSAFPFADRAVFVNHHRAHAASAYYASGYDEAAVLILDGYGDALSSDSFETISLYAANHKGITTQWRVGGSKRGLHLSNSAGILYRMGTLLAGFGIMDEGKTMGLAAYGKPQYTTFIMNHINVENSALTFDNEAIWQTFCERGLSGGSFEQRADIAASFQTALESIVLHYAKLAKDKTGARYLCLAGGVGLNCVANQKIVEEKLFDQVFVFPAAADNGIAFGSAYIGAHDIYRLPPNINLQHAYFGRTYTEHEIKQALAPFDRQLTVECLDDQAMADKVAQSLAESHLVMWYQGGSEFGPRALGHRSILGDPRKPEIRAHINAAVKSREAFRPLAPIVLAEESETWFECQHSPFMLFSPRVKPATREHAPAIVHADGTARLQTITQQSNAKLHNLIKAFQALTGVPMLLNTSFNINSEPIVETPTDALTAFMSSPVDVLCIEQFLVKKNGGSTC